MKIIAVPLILILATARASAEEVQQHGLVLEHWICDTFFNGYRPPGYTQKWDIPAEENTSHGGLPINPKATKYKTPVGLGDALRQFEITSQNTPFILIVAYWEQISPTEKKWVNAQTLTITPETWQKLWNPITEKDLQRLDSVIKDKTRSISETRALAQAIKSQPPFTEAIITVNPKINSSQRRLQCSLSFSQLFEHLAPGADPTIQAAPKIWGHALPPLPNSPPRTFQPKPEKQ